MAKIMCFGTFDNFHPGHLSYLKQAKKFGDYLIVIIARDKNVLELKKKLPSQTEKIRLAGVKKTGLADKAVLGGLKNKFTVLKKYKPEIICLGYDQIVNEEALKKIFKGRILRMKPFKEHVYKSSKLIKF
jgi:FAD synthetase